MPTQVRPARVPESLSYEVLQGVARDLANAFAHSLPFTAKPRTLPHALPLVRIQASEVDATDRFKWHPYEPDPNEVTLVLVSEHRVVK